MTAQVVLGPVPPQMLVTGLHRGEPWSAGVYRPDGQAFPLGDIAELVFDVTSGTAVTWIATRTTYPTGAAGNAFSWSQTGDAVTDLLDRAAGPARLLYVAADGTIVPWARGRIA